MLLPGYSRNFDGPLATSLILHFPGANRFSSHKYLITKDFGIESSPLTGNVKTGFNELVQH
jgi:hypothetical protein